MRSRSINLLPVLSLLPCVAVVAIWARSFSVGEHLYHARFREGGVWTYWVRDELYVGNGQVGFAHAVSSGDRGSFRDRVERNVLQLGGEPPFRREVDPSSASLKLGNNARRFFGFGIARSSYVRRDGSVCAATDRVTVPLWAFAAVLGTMPAAALVLTYGKHLRHLAGTCVRCGYDLRATPGRCPECGTVAPEAAST